MGFLVLVGTANRYVMAVVPTPTKELDPCQVQGTLGFGRVLAT